MNKITIKTAQNGSLAYTETPPSSQRETGSCLCVFPDLATLQVWLSQNLDKPIEQQRAEGKP